MNLDLSPADQAFQADVRNYLAQALPDHLRQAMAMTPSVFVEADIAVEWQRILHAKGWLAYQWPVEVGGTGWSAVQRYIFEKECALAGAPGLVALGLKLVAPVIYTFGTPAQKETFLPKILTGEHYWCQGFSEPGSGSDLASLKTRAERRGDHYVISGSKIWTTHAHHANWMFCLARTDTSVKPQRGISFLLIDMSLPGIEVRPIITMAGDHEVNQVFLDQVEIPVACRVGEEGQGWEIAKFLLENERGGSCYAPSLLASLTRVADLARQQPSGNCATMVSDRDFRRDYARLEIEAKALEMIELKILSKLAKGERPGPETSLIKLMASNLRQQVDELAVSVLGYAALPLETQRPLYGNHQPEPVTTNAAQVAMPTYLNSRAWTIFGGSDEVQKNIIAKMVLGL